MGSYKIFTVISNVIKINKITNTYVDTIWKRLKQTRRIRMRNWKLYNITKTDTDINIFKSNFLLTNVKTFGCYSIVKYT